MASASGGSPFSGDDDGRMITDINVTPLVDITLVLLIIFMVTTTYIVNPSIKVELPRAATGDEQAKTELALTLDREGRLFVNGEATSEAQAEARIATLLPRDPEVQAIIAADRVVPHGRVVEIIDLVRRAGVRRFAIHVEAP